MCTDKHCIQHKDGGRVNKVSLGTVQGCVLLMHLFHHMKNTKLESIERGEPIKINIPS